jgi:hypothetical protein
MSKQSALKKSQPIRTSETLNESPNESLGESPGESQLETAASVEKPRSALTIALVALLMLVALILANMR